MPLTLPSTSHLQALRDRAAVFERYRGFDRCMRKLLSPSDQPPAFAAVTELYAHWGDPPTQSTESFLRSCLTEAARAEGPIVLCGAGALAFVLGSLCHRGGREHRQLWCLEHDHHWASIVRSWITQYGIGSTHVITSRPRLFERYVWYAVDVSRLAANVSLVLCDGARATPRGIIGALARLDSRLAAEFVILARNVTRAEDLRRIQHWAERRDASCVVVDRQEGFVKISRRAPDQA
ncbi:MAG: hypothetical protein ACODAC_08685 [Pseudomonadota bacterium]